MPKEPLIEKINKIHVLQSRCGIHFFMDQDKNFYARGCRGTDMYLKLELEKNLWQAIDQTLSAGYLVVGAFEDHDEVDSTELAELTLNIK